MTSETTQTIPDISVINTRLRACEACKTRKIRCDKLDPCSACRASNIPCWTTREPQRKRQRTTPPASSQEHYLEGINEKLTEIQNAIRDLNGVRSQSITQSLPTPSSNPDLRHIATPTTFVGAESSHETPFSDSTYRGESSFEAHSQQTGQILETTLLTSTVAQVDKDTSTALRSLRELTVTQEKRAKETYSTNLPLVPAPIALALLRLLTESSHAFIIGSPSMGYERVRDICTRVYFPVNGFTLSDFIIANGALTSIISQVNEEDLVKCNISPEQAIEIEALCGNNIRSTVANMSPFLEPTAPNIEALLSAAQISVEHQEHQQALTLVAMAARLCIDAGFNKLEEDPKDPELNLKKSCFWFTYSLDKSFSLSFGRAPTISDFDIATEYPIFPKTPFSDLIFVWLDIGKIQSRAYQKLYSARGKLRSSESKEHNARTLISQLQILRERCQVSFAEMDDHELEMLLPTDFSILSIMTFIYHALPQSRPSHPFQFSNECIVTAREALQAHLDVCTKFFQKPLNVIRTYVNYTLAFSPFTPFIVVLGTAISKASSEDVALLTQVVNSLETASARAHGAKKLYNICKILLQGAKTCIDQAVGNTSILRGGDASIKQRHTSHNEDTSSRDDNGSLPQLSRTDLAYQPLPSDYWHTQLNSSDDMMMLFDSYLAGNPSMMQLFETELSQFEG